MIRYKNLNMGCGLKEFPNCLNADIRKTPITQVIVDFDKFSYPFKNNSFEKIFAFDIIEHLIDVIKAIEEIHRILKPRGILMIRTSYWKTENSFTDPTHKHFFTLRSFDYFDPSTQLGKDYGFYSNKKFRILDKRVDGQELMFTMQKQEGG